MPKETKRALEFLEAWKGICCSRCYNAESDKKKCKCRCHGEHHGIGRQATQDKAKQEKLEVEKGGQHETNPNSGC